MKKIILASQSPRRNTILRKVVPDFGLIFPNVVEDIVDSTFSFSKIEKIAKSKALAVENIAGSNSIIISADTVVVLDDIILTKPHNRKEAMGMLSDLSGNKHRVVTAVCMLDTDTKRCITRSATTFVTFRRLTNDEIMIYVDIAKPFDKAGAYGIQETTFAIKIEGSFDNVVGLCPQMVTEMLEELAVKF